MMLIRKITIGLLATFTHAQSPVPGLLATLTKDVGQFNQTIAAYNGGINGLLPLGESATVLLNDIKNSAAGIVVSPPIEFEEALALASTVDTLVKNSESIVDTFIADKPKFSNIAAATFVRSTFASIRAGVATFGEAIKAKLPPEMIPVANKLLQMLDQAYERGQEAFAP